MATRNAINDAWYRRGRADVEAVFADGNLVAGSEVASTSPSGRYRLELHDYRVGGDAFTELVRGRVYRGDTLVADVKRNYGIFHFGWAENHPNRHDYLLCGEDYQGQTVVELDTGRRADFTPPEAEPGHAFCCADYYPSPDGRFVVVDGCHWGAPYELRMFRFDDPMSLPWPFVEQIAKRVVGKTEGWTPDGFVYENAEEVRITDGKGNDELTEAEWDDLIEREQLIGGERVRRCAWSPSGGRRVLEERVTPTATPIPAIRVGTAGRRCSACGAEWEDGREWPFALCPQCGRLTQLPAPPP
jgi:hypothetical protein